MGAQLANNPPIYVTGVLPQRLLLRGKLHGNHITQLAQPLREVRATVTRRVLRGAPQAILRTEQGDELAVVARGRRAPLSATIEIPEEQFVATGFPIADLKDARWLSPRPTAPATLAPIQRQQLCSSVLSSLVGAFRFTEEDAAAGTSGLRPPQMGALHGVLAHWAVREDIASVILPTGTGKTETMLALFAHERIPRLLVVVPTDRLRTQTVDKFISFGLLKSIAVLDESASYPVVGALSTGLIDVASAEDFALSCNVIVTTMSLIASMRTEVRSALVSSCTHLFVDEAHHVPAKTWHLLRTEFSGKRVVQFTATPFRNDGKHVDGHVAFRYPLARAQAEGYFSEVTFSPIAELVPEESDGAIAAKAIAQLRMDLTAGRDHLVMARASSIERAETIAAVYREVAADLGVIILHSKLSPQARNTALEALSSRSARIVCCVDMLGEGVDLPSLKIAALHDAHQSLAVTLQFIGRFARTSSSLGTATVVANLVDEHFEKSLRALYAEDADWNIVLRTLTDEETDRHAVRESFARSFEEISEIPVQNVNPKMSVLVYRTDATEWNADAVHGVFARRRVVGKPLVNKNDHTILVVTKDEAPISWGDIRGLQDVVYHLHLAHWSPGARLFFVNTTDKDEFHGELARAVMGSQAELLHGEAIFRVLSGINRLQLMNLGLKSTVNRRIQFSMMMGHDIVGALTDPQQQNKMKSNLFGVGFERGEATSIGCSQKGRVWAHKVAANIPDWISWANRIGAKIIDNAITTNTVLRNVVLPERAKQRPASVPISIEWSVDIFRNGDEYAAMAARGIWVPFYEIGIDIQDLTETGPIRFAVGTDADRATYEVRFGGERVVYQAEGIDPEVRFGRRVMHLSEFLIRHPPIIRFADGSFLSGDDLCKIDRTGVTPFARDKIVVWAWDGVDPAKEAQGRPKRGDSIQAKVLRDLVKSTKNYDVVFNDDDPGEVADVVAIKTEEGRIVVDMFHCKFAHGGFRAARVDDLYEVCGQAQKSVLWCRDLTKLLRHLRRRESSYKKKYGVSRFEKGGSAEISRLLSIAPMSDVVYSISIVQPGLSRTRSSEQQLHLLGGTATYLAETYAVDLTAIGSD